jgi:predicted transcriptional regulator of viral defense system
MQSKNKTNKEKELIELAISQGGYFTAKQALKFGYSYRAQNYYVETKQWLKEDRALYRFSFLPFSKENELIKAYFWSRDKKDIPRAVISHESALYVHGIGEMISDKINLAVPKSFRKKAPKKYLIHKDDLGSKEIEKRDSFKVTNVVKTIIDLVEKIDPEQLKKIVEDAYKKGLISQHEIELSNSNVEVKRKLLSVFAQVRSKR